MQFLRCFLVCFTFFLVETICHAENINKLKVTLNAKGYGGVISIENIDIFPRIIGMEAYKDEIHTEKILSALLTIEPKSAVEVKIPEFDIGQKKRNIYLEYSQAIGRTNIKQRKNAFRIPFQKDTTIIVCQSADGPQITHLDKPYAIDFCVPENTPIIATRDGVVTEVVQEYKESGWKEELKNKANFINILHDDGFITRYVHLPYNGSKVSVGDRVKVNQIIGVVGMTGYTNGPHLHFELLEPKEGFLIHQSFYQVINPNFINNSGKSLDLVFKKTYKVDD